MRGGGEAVEMERRSEMRRRGYGRVAVEDGQAAPQLGRRSHGEG